MTADLLIRGLIQFVVIAIVIRKASDGKFSRIRAMVVGLIAGVSTIAIHILLQQYPFPAAIAHWVQTANFR